MIRNASARLSILTDESSDSLLLLKKTLDRVAACFTGRSTYRYEFGS